MRNGQLSFLPKAERPQNEALPSDFSVYSIAFLVANSEIGPRPCFKVSSGSWCGGGGRAKTQTCCGAV